VIPCLSRFFVKNAVLFYTKDRNSNPQMRSSKLMMGNAQNAAKKLLLCPQRLKSGPPATQAEDAKNKFNINRSKSVVADPNFFDGKN
jgi:hypothetical protein